MYTTFFNCPSCGNSAIAKATFRFVPLTDKVAAASDDGPTEKERFLYLGIGNHYNSFLKRKKKMSEKEAFDKITEETTISYKEWKSTKGRAMSAEDAYKILGLVSSCCQRSVFTLPVIPNYNPYIPPDSAIKIDNGEIQRIVTRNGMNYETNEYIEQEIPEPSPAEEEEVKPRSKRTKKPTFEESEEEPPKPKKSKKPTFEDSDEEEVRKPKKKGPVGKKEEVAKSKKSKKPTFEESEEEAPKIKKRDISEKRKEKLKLDSSDEVPVFKKRAIKAKKVSFEESE